MLCSQLFTLLLVALSLTLVTSEELTMISKSNQRHKRRSIVDFVPQRFRESQRLWILQGQLNAIEEQVGKDISKGFHEVLQRIDDLEVHLKYQDEMYKETLPKSQRKAVTFVPQIKPKKNWFEALAECRKQGLDLASLENEDEFNLMLDEIRFAISGKDPTENRFWLSATNFTREYTYVWFSTGQGGCFAKWCDLEPNRYVHNSSTSREIEDCMQLKDKCMNDYFCSHRLNYICENRTNDVSTSTIREKNKEFELFTNNSHQVSWFEAFVACRRKGMRLATIENEDENQAVVNLIESKNCSNHEFWLSGSDLGKSGHYVWMTTGQPLGRYNAWSEGQNFPHGHCMKTNVDGKWLRYPCFEKMYFICQNQD